jgi:hypothetical protein
VKQNSARNLFARENEKCNAKLGDFFSFASKKKFSVFKQKSEAKLCLKK